MSSLLPATTITAAISPAVVTTPMQFLDETPHGLLIQANFIYGSSGGTTVDAYVQTTIDGGATWIDIAEFNFTTASARKVANLSSLTPVTTIATPVDGTLASNTCVDGIIGSKLRVKYKSAGTYVGATSLQIDVTTTRLTG
jgi:hypothetical protein